MCMIHFKEMWLCSSNTDVISFCLHSSYSSIASVALIFIKPQPLKRGIYVMTMSICLFVCSSIAWNNAATMADIPSQRHLRSATRHHLTVPHYRLCTFGRQAFSVAGPTVWNSLPDSLWPGTHRQQLQTIAENEPISSLPLGTHSAVEVLHDSALYKSIIDIDIMYCTSVVGIYLIKDVFISLAMSTVRSVLSVRICTHEQLLEAN